MKPLIVYRLRADYYINGHRVKTEEHSVRDLGHAKEFADNMIVNNAGSQYEGIEFHLFKVSREEVPLRDWRE